MNEVTFSDRDIWIAALWFGMLMGLGEAAIFFGWQAAGDEMYVTADIVWAAVLFDTIVCLLAAAAVVGLARLWSGVRAHAGVILAFLLFASWVAVGLHDRVYTWVLPVLAAGLAVATMRWLGAEGRLQRITRGTLPALLLLGVGASLAVPLAESWSLRKAKAALPTPVSEAPNVLILLIDTFRADHSSAYGYERETTPRIDELAREGMLFEEAYATSSYTLASHASLLTGLYPHEHGAQWDVPLGFHECDCATLGGALQERGYVTAGFSANPFWFTEEHGFGRGFLEFDGYFHSLWDAFHRTAFGRAVEQMILPRLGYLDIPARKQADFVNGRVLDWIDDRGDRPFFGFVNYFDIHDPYLPPEPYRSRFAGKPVGGIINWRINGLDPQLEPSVIQDEMDAYDGAITYVDEQIGLLVDALEDRGVLDNTILVVTSDHGEEFGEHGHVLHGHSLYRQSIHVPLVLWNPDRIPGGVRISTPVSNAATPSTVMDLVTGERGPFPWPSLMTAEGDSVDSTPALAELVLKPWGPESFPTFHGAMQSIADGRWHYIRHEVFGPELYDVEADPEEQDDLAGVAAYQETVQELDRRIDELRDGH